MSYKLKTPVLEPPPVRKTQKTKEVNPKLWSFETYVMENFRLVMDSLKEINRKIDNNLKWIIGIIITLFASATFHFDNKIDKLDNKINKNKEELQAQITNVEKQVLEIKSDVKLILNYQKKK